MFEAAGGGVIKKYPTAGLQAGEVYHPPVSTHVEQPTSTPAGDPFSSEPHLTPAQEEAIRLAEMAGASQPTGFSIPEPVSAPADMVFTTQPGMVEPVGAFFEVQPQVPVAVTPQPLPEPTTAPLSGFHLTAVRRIAG
jgi:hypothetical protein